MKPQDQTKDAGAKNIAERGSVAIAGNMINSAISIAVNGISRADFLKWMLLILVLFALIAFIISAIGPRELTKRVLGIGQCFAFDPRSDTQTPSLGARPCFPGNLVYFKWFDDFDYIGYWKARDPNSHPDNRPQDRPNRIVQVVGMEGGHVKWLEQELVSLQGGIEQWGPNGMRWVTLDDSYPAAGTRGIVIRRMDYTAIPVGNGKTECDSDDRKRNLFEWFFPLDSVQKIARGENPHIFHRKVKVSCDKEIGYGMLEGPDFIDTGMKIVRATPD